MRKIHTILFALITGVAFITPLSGKTYAQNKDLTPDQVTALIHPYLHIQQSLAADNLTEAKLGAAAFVEAVEQNFVDSGNQEEPDSPLFLARYVANSTNIAAGRTAFQALTQEFVDLLKHVGTTRTEPLFLVHCPMAFGNKGADWVQDDKTVANPYFGATMLRCGSVKAEISPRGNHLGNAQGGHKAHH